MLKKNLTKWWSWLVEGLLSTGPTPSSLFVAILSPNQNVPTRWDSANIDRRAKLF